MEEKEGSFGCFAADLLLCDEESESLSLCEPSFCNGESETGKQFIELPPLMSDECFYWMVEREKEYLPVDSYLERLRSGEINSSLRSEAFDWMLKACVHHSFGDACLYSAMNHFDRFLSVYDLPEGKAWPAQLVAVSCLLLAAKLDEVNIPNAVDLQCALLHQTGETRFLFEARRVHRMEMILLNTLKWNIKPYTPLHFLEYFIYKINHRNPLQKHWISRSIHILPSMIKGIEFLEFRPSEIGAAVAIYISGEMQAAMDFFPDKALHCFIGVEKDKVIKCLTMIQSLIPTHSVASGSLLSVTSSPNGVLEAIFEHVFESSPSSLANRRLDMNPLSTTLEDD